MKMPILRWAFYLLIAASVLIAVRWFPAPIAGHATPASRQSTEPKSKQKTNDSLGTANATSPAQSAWLTDLKKAQEEAKASHKFLLLNFTGSDWCGFCIQLDRAIFSQPQFRDYAHRNLVLVELDFPRRKKQAIETQEQNAELAERYQVQAFPTLVLLDAGGKMVWRYEGLYQGSLAAFLADLDKVRKG